MATFSDFETTDGAPVAFMVTDTHGDLQSKLQHDSHKDHDCMHALSNQVEGQWVLDSGCTDHMMSNRSEFATYQALNPP